MSEQEHTPHGASVAFRDPAEREAPAATVRLEDLLATMRRHIWLVLGVAPHAEPEHVTGSQNGIAASRLRRCGRDGRKQERSDSPATQVHPPSPRERSRRHLLRSRKDRA